MAHAVELLISRPPMLSRARDLLRTLVAPSIAIEVCPLALGFAALPLTKPVYAAIKSFVAVGSVPRTKDAKRLYFGDGWRYDDQAIPIFARWLSADAPIAYVETNYWAGAGDQGAVVWARQKRAWGPTRGAEDVIHQALALLGDELRGLPDRFAALGLGAHRSSDDWVALTAK
jgi:hypothetical protein